ncbi:hypothetical protein RO3G_13455 [Rhizopus delemar RA 99-880]|uniref:Uncharacterized protein n=1 Tax=Rhizopus delemar (strain RA 99-880 / ATCC MYA-4621 / FGSC 9543 / NRRL 43880) TaxID=246409 RepID=I1CJW4_RHIO9|nr:hypothetical protein RO3G_13455 [Rhizopus delemar RA 99-880]|eukprot:EIE88744.1 hypothetical protein RO3G_13455 [Rhizopus delemar RA 99-880]
MSDIPNLEDHCSYVLAHWVNNASRDRLLDVSCEELSNHTEKHTIRIAMKRSIV